MKELTLADIAALIENMKCDLADAVRARGVEPVAISANEVARVLGVNRKAVYQMHKAGDLNGFRPTPRSHLRFLVEEVREMARRKSEKRWDA